MNLKAAEAIRTRAAYHEAGHVFAMVACMASPFEFVEVATVAEIARSFEGLNGRVHYCGMRLELHAAIFTVHNPPLAYAAALFNLAGPAAECYFSELIGEPHPLDEMLFEMEMDQDPDLTRADLYLDPLGISPYAAGEDATTLVTTTEAWSAISRLATALVETGRLEYDEALAVMRIEPSSSFKNIRELLEARRRT